MKILIKVIATIFLFFGSFALCSAEETLSGTSNPTYGIVIFASPGITTNSSMPSILGFQVSKKFQTVDFYFELAQGKYKNDPIFSSTVVSGEKNEKKPKIIYTAGLKGVFADYFLWDLGVGINQFSYSNSGLDLTCCVNKEYIRSYDFSGVFIRPSFGVQLTYDSWNFGLRLFSWMEYLSKTVSNKVDEKPDNPYISLVLDDNERDNIQSSHLIPPHIYVTFSF